MLYGENNCSVEKNHWEKFGNDLMAMCENGELCDMTLVCEDGDIHAHRFVLSTWSNAFSKMLKNPPTQHQRTKY